MNCTFSLYPLAHPRKPRVCSPTVLIYSGQCHNLKRPLGLRFSVCVSFSVCYNQTQNKAFVFVSGRAVRYQGGIVVHCAKGPDDILPPRQYVAVLRMIFNLGADSLYPNPGHLSLDEVT